MVISSAGMSTEEEAEAKAAFALLRPVCVEVMRAPSVEALRALDVQLACLPSLHPHLVDYVALPLRTIIKRTGRYSSSRGDVLRSTRLVLRFNGLGTSELKPHYTLSLSHTHTAPICSCLRQHCRLSP